MDVAVESDKVNAPVSPHPGETTSEIPVESLYGSLDSGQKTDEACQDVPINDSEEETNTCNACNTDCKSYDELVDHLTSNKECAAKSETTLLELVCPLCKREFGHNGALKNHTKFCLTKRYSKKTGEMPLAIVAPIQAQLVNSQGPNEDESVVLDDQIDSTDSGTFESDCKRYFKGTNICRVCEGCDLIFKSPGHVQKHLQKKKLYCRRPPYTCNKCGKICKNIHALIEHEKSRVACRKWLIISGSEIPLSSLEEPDSKFSESSEILESVLVDTKSNIDVLESGETSSLSDSLNNSARSSDMLDPNVTVEKEAKVLIKKEIVDCDYETISTPSLDVLLEEKLEENPEKAFFCQACSLQFLNSYRLRKHVLAVHRNFKPQSIGLRSKYIPKPSQASPRKPHNTGMSPFKCEGGYRCPTCLLVFIYPSKLSTHLFRKGKCHPPSLGDGTPLPDQNKTLELNETKNNHKIQMHSNVKFPDPSLDGVPSDNSFAPVNVRQNKLTPPIKGVINVPVKSNPYLPPKQNVLNRIVKKYRKLNHQNSGVVPFCEFCQLSFCSKSGLNKHYEKYHGGEPAPDSNLKGDPCGCPFCDRCFVTIKARNTHVRFGHKDLPEEEIATFISNTLCEVCAKTFDTVADMKEHFSATHGQQFTEATLHHDSSIDSELSCNRCGLQFTTKHHYSAHVNRYCSTLKVQSKSASPISTTNIRPKSGLAAFAIKRPKGGFVCEHCNTKFSYRTLYKAHINRYCPMKTSLSSANNSASPNKTSPPVSSTSDMICPYCQQKFVRKYLYDTHVKIICPRRQTSSPPKAAIRRPLRVGRWHGKKYSCWGCRKVFPDRRCLCKHQKMGCSGITFGPNSESVPTSDSALRALLSDTNSTKGSKEWLGVGFSYVCQGCKNRFNSKKTLIYHQKSLCPAHERSSNTSYKDPPSVESSQNMMNKSSPVKPFVCRACNNTFISEKTLYNHQKLVCKGFSQNSESPKSSSVPRSNGTPPLQSKPPNTGGLAYTCRGCLSQFETRKDLYSHKLSNYQTGESADGSQQCHMNCGFACKKCMKRCVSRKVLYVHQKFHCKYSKFKAPNVLSNSFKFPSILPKPLKVSSFVPKPLKTPNFVPRLLKTPNFVPRLLKTPSFSPKPVRALGAIPKSPVSLPMVSDALSDQKCYQCKTCPDKFPSRKHLFLHHKYHCIGRIHQLQSKPENSLDLETRSVSSTFESQYLKPQSRRMKYSCSQCKKGFHNRKVLFLHKKCNCLGVKNDKDLSAELSMELDESENVPGVKGYLCKRCHHTFGNRKLLFIHKKFDCPSKCVQKMTVLEPDPVEDENHVFTPKKGVMTAAIEDKLQVFPNQCPFCKREFSNPIIRDKHIKMHTMVKSLCCSVCRETFSRSQYLSKHMMSEHPEKLRYQCGKCGMTYVRRISCIQHLNKLHKVINKVDMIIDLAVNDRTSQLGEVSEMQGIVPLLPKTSVPKLTLKRTSLVTRFKKRRAIWKPSVSPSFFRVVDDLPGKGIYSCELCQVSKFSKMSTLHRHWRSRLHKDNVARQRAGLISLPSQEKEDFETMVCSVCHQSFLSVQAFVPHRLSHLNDPYEISDLQPYSCEICSSVFTHHQRVQGHLMWHLRVSKNQTKEPGLQPIQPLVNILKLAAKKSISPTKEYEPLKTLQEKTNTKPAFPTNTMPPQEPFECSMCSSQYASKSGVMTHMRRFCPKRFMCNKCGQCFSNARVLAYHNGRNECRVGTNDVLKCRHCSLELETAEDLGWHEKSCRKVHESEKAGTFEGSELSSFEEDRYPCSSCKQTFSSITAACKHEEICLSTRSLGSSLSYHCLQCMVCKENFYSVRILEKHANVHRMERFYVRCLPCQKLFHNLKDLSEHISKLSSSISPVEVSEEASGDLLTSSQSESSALLPNLRNSQSKPQTRKIVFPCQHCRKVFRDKHNLRIHLVLHTPFQCPVCNRVETTKNGFKLHECLLPDGSFATGLGHRNIRSPNRRSHLVSPSSSGQVSALVSESDGDDCQESELPSSSTAPCQNKETDGQNASLNKLRGDFSQLMFFLVADPELMTQLGWGQKPIDGVLKDVLVHLGETPACETDVTIVTALDLELLRENIRRFLKLSVKEDVLDTLDGIDHSSVDDVVAKMLGMCTDNGEDETSNH